MTSPGERTALLGSPLWRLLVLLALGLLAICAARPARAAEPVALRRFALVVGTNDGGPARVRLRYAQTDAQAFARVLEGWGGVSRADRLVVLEPTVDRLREALGDLHGRVRAASGARRVEVLFYYSGHSDEEGLLPAGARMPYQELRRAIDAMPADVRIVVLDSCSSGALTRRKGGTRRAPFLVDESGRVTGHAFLTSSAAEESAQESDRIGGSFFTHYLLSGLRGAADASRDGRVTLSEAYQFAFNETLSRTERTSGGPQHPAYDIQLAGTGDLVMTDLRQTSAGLVVAREVDGRLFVRDKRGHLVVEVAKAPTHAIELGLEPGEYRVTLDKGGKVYALELRVAAGGRARIGGDRFTEQAPEAVALRGGPEAAIATPPGGYKRVPFNLSLLPTVSLSGEDSPRTIEQFSLNVVGQAARLEGAELGLGMNWILEDARWFQLAVGANLVGRNFTGAQVAAGANVVKGRVEGAQLAAGASWASRGLRGFQAANGLAWTEELVGVQLAAVTRSTEAHGGQVGLVNVGGNIEGLQLGLVNVATGKVRGAQIGLVNVADDVEGAPIGIVSWVRKGMLHGQVWGSDTALSNVGLQIGSRHIYSLVSASVTPSEGKTRWMAGVGLGGHLPITETVWSSLDVSALAVGRGDDTDGDPALVRLRLSFGWQASDHLGVFGGPALNVYSSGKDDGKDLVLGGPSYAETRSGRTVRLWPGFFLGVRI